MTACNTHLVSHLLVCTVQLLLCVGRVTCRSNAVIAPISSNSLIVTHRYRRNNVAMTASVEGSDVMGVCVDPTQASFMDYCTAETSITTSSSNCRHSDVAIVDQAPVFTSPVVVYRSKQLNLQGMINIKCGTTLRNTKVNNSAYQQIQLIS